VRTIYELITLLYNLKIYHYLNHFVTIVRSPLLGQAPPVEHWLAVFVITLVGWVLTFFYTKYRWRIAYWV